MLQFWMNLVLAILSVLGLMYLYQFFSRWLLRCKPPFRQYIILEFMPQQEDAEYLLRCQIAKIKAEHSERYSRILCITDGMSPAIYQICCRLCQDCSFLFLCSKARLHEYLQTL